MPGIEEQGLRLPRLRLPYLRAFIGADNLQIGDGPVIVDIAIAKWCEFAGHAVEHRNKPSAVSWTRRLFGEQALQYVASRRDVFDVRYDAGDLCRRALEHRFKEIIDKAI